MCETRVWIARDDRQPDPHLHQPRRLGETHLGDMSRVSKTHPRIEAYGTVDELNAHIGVALTIPGLPDATPSGSRASRTTCSTSAPTCGAGRPASESGSRRRSPSRPRGWSSAATRSTRRSRRCKSFVLPGGTPAAAHLHVCRTVCRRAERLAIACGAEVNAEVVRYLNRLSDLLFILSRAANAEPDASARRRVLAGGALWRRASRIDCRAGRVTPGN